MNTICSRCKDDLEDNRIGKQRYCLSCHNAYMRMTRPSYSQFTELQRLKANCRSYLNTYVKRGKITKPECCQFPDCKETKIQAHHDDYTKPLDVIWYCESHHIFTHSLI